MPLNAEIAAQAAQFGPAFPRDPADRIIAATALAHGLTLVTADQKIRSSGLVPTLW
ncbi:MAG: PIN domain-containing protein [Terriglobales bacterium]